MKYPANIPFRLWLLTLCVLTETFAFTYLRDVYSLDINIFLFAISGLGVALISLWPCTLWKNNSVVPSKVLKITVSLIAAIGICILIAYRSIHTIQAVGFGAWADMMPFIKVQCVRLLHGETVYKVIPELWGQVPPYLPMFWLPFVPFEAAHMDIRYMLPVFLIGAVICIWAITYRTRSLPWILLLLSIGGLFFLVNFCVSRDIIFIASTEEAVAIFYYAFLGWAFTTRKPILIGFAIANCIMSRFMLIGWAPCFIVYMFFMENKKQALQMALACIIWLAIVFIVPFFIYNPAHFLHLPAEYTDVCRDHWGKALFFNSFKNKMSFIKYFQPKQFELAHMLGEISVIVFPVVIFIVLAVLRKSKVPFNYTFIGTGTLKLVMCAFYALPLIPDNYLFYLPAFFSYCILFQAYKQVYGSTSQSIASRIELS